MRPDFSRVPSFYHGYINQVPEDDLMQAFKNGTSSEHDRKANWVPVRDYRYADGKWTIKEVLQHIIDGERVFDYRALCFARKDPSPLPGFDENIFAANSKTDKRKWDELVEEFKVVRKGSEILFGSFDDEQLNMEGVANNHKNYVLAFGYVVVGHSLHHVRIIKERYL